MALFLIFYITMTCSIYINCVIFIRYFLSDLTSIHQPLRGVFGSVDHPLSGKSAMDQLGHLTSSGDSKVGLPWAMASRFLVGPLFGLPFFFLIFLFKFVWLIYTLDNLRPAIF